MGLTAADYLQQLQALLPPGAAWSRDATAVLTRLLAGLAAELARADGRGEALLEEADPRSVGELIAEWETAFGLPDPCTGVLETLVQRRQALTAKVGAQGGQSRGYFIALAAAVGYVVTIDEVVDGNQYKWRINAPAVTVTYFRAGTGRSGERLASWGNTLLECIITRCCPAHTQVVFGYA